MANFNGLDEAMGAAFKTPSNLLCQRCGQYGRVSFQVFVTCPDGKNVHAVNSVVCLFCKEGERRGRLIAIYTGFSGKPDFSCRDAKLPEGYSVEDLRRALENKPLRRSFHYTELKEGRKELF